MEHTPGLETSPPGSDTLDVARGVGAPRSASRGGSSRLVVVSIGPIEVDAIELVPFAAIDEPDDRRDPGVEPAGIEPATSCLQSRRSPI